MSRTRRRAARAAAPWLVLAAVGVPACPAPRPAAERVVLVTIDTLRADRVGAYGDPSAHTPHLDALAAAGVRFATAVAPTPLTLPSHASLLTGLDPPRHGVRHNGLYRLPDDVPTLAERLGAAGFATGAFVSAFVLDRRFGLGRGFEHYGDRLEPPGGGGAIGMPERRADRAVDEALAWLARAPDRFLLWLHLYDPHAPYDPPPRFAALRPDEPYAGEVAFADAELGRLLAALRARWGERGTLVAVTSDHGEALGEHGEPTHAYGLYDATQRVPLVLSGAGLPAGLVVEELVRLVDLAPTLLECAGAAPLPRASGRSLLPLLRGRAEPERTAYLETLATQLDLGWSPLLGLRTARHKYVRAPRPELYDLAADPGETRNRAAAEPARAAELDGQLAALLAGAQPAAEPAPGLDPSERARLEELGYVVAREPAAAELGVVGGIDPKDAIGDLALLNEANALVGRGRGEEALARLDALGARGHPVDALRAMAALAAGRPDLARRAAEAALAGAPAGPAGHGLLGHALEAQGDLDGAEAAYRRAGERGPALGWPLTGQGRIAEWRGDRAGAAALYRRALEARVPDPDARWHLAALELEDGEVEAGSRRLAQVPAHALRREAAALRLGRAELAAARPELGLLRVRAGLGERPDSPRLRLLEGRLLEELGRDEEALAARERALRAAPEDPVARNDVAWSLALLGRDLERARALAQAAAGASGSLPETVDTLAAVHLGRGDAARALALVEGALPAASGETRALLLLHRAEALARLGRRAQARASLDEARAAAPGRGRVWERRAARVEALLGKSAVPSPGGSAAAGPHRPP